MTAVRPIGRLFSYYQPHPLQPDGLPLQPVKSPDKQMPQIVGKYHSLRKNRRQSVQKGLCSFNKNASVYLTTVVFLTESKVESQFCPVPLLGESAYNTN